MPVLAALWLSLPSDARASELLTVLGAQTGSQAGHVTALETHRDWQLACETGPDGRACRVLTFARGSGADGAAVAIELSGEPVVSGDPLFRFLMPLDLMVANGVEMRFGNGPPLRLAYRSCHLAGCLVPFRLTREIAARFRSDNAFTVRAFDLQGRPIDISVSLLGFSAAFTQLASRP